MKIIYCRENRCLGYYKHTSFGRPIFGSKRGAAKIYGDQLETVVSHLRIMRPQAEIGLIDEKFKWPRKKKIEAENANPPSA